MSENGSGATSDSGGGAWPVYTPGTVYERLRWELENLSSGLGLYADEVVVTTPLSAAEAIGNPEDHDYPIIVGREAMMEASIRGTRGQAFTDMHGPFSASLSDIAALPLTNSFRRGVFVATLNAVCRYAGLIPVSRHCRDQAPRRCADQVVEQIGARYGEPRILLVGLQPRLLERLARDFQVRATDLDRANVGEQRFGVLIHDARETDRLLKWCDLALVTGTTLVNATIGPFLERTQEGKPTIFYGVTISGAARLLGLDHMCPFGE